MNTHTTQNSLVITTNKRISELDLVRGFAVFGIFFLNILSMGYPVEAYTNPLVFTVSDLAHSNNNTNWLDNQTLNDIFFSFTHIFIDQKMMGLFSVLFGASTMLFLSKLKEKNLSVAYYFKRNGWLLLFGLLHGTFLYFGDILFLYSLCAFALFFFTGLRPTIQLIIGIIIYCIPIILQWRMQLSINDFSIEQMQLLNEIWKPDLEIVKETIDFNRTASYSNWVASSIDFTEYEYSIYDWYYDAYIVELLARSFGMMLIGMSFFTWGILPNQKNCKPVGFYWKSLTFGFTIGLILIILGLCLNFHYDWRTSYSAVGGRLLNHIGTPFLVCAYISMLVLWSNQKDSPVLIQNIKEKLQSVGQMALTNYIMHSALGLFLFNSIGFSLHSQLNRLELIGVVVIVCLFQLYFSSFYLKRSSYGPLEWLWRSLTYFKLTKLN